MINRLRIFVIIGMLVLSGCGDKREEVEKRILTYDPSFQEVIDQIKSVRHELESQKVLYKEKVRDIEGQIVSLKESRVSVKANHLEELEKIKKRLSPKKRSLQQELVDAQRRLKIRKMEADNIGKDISEINSLVNKKDRLELTREEAQTWNQRLYSLIERRSLVEKEIAKLEEEIKITKLKIKVLTFK